MKLLNSIHLILTAIIEITVFISLASMVAPKSFNLGTLYYLIGATHALRQFDLLQ